VQCKPSTVSLLFAMNTAAFNAMLHLSASVGVNLPTSHRKEDRLVIPWDQFSSLMPRGRNKSTLQGDWTDVLYEHYHDLNPSCPLVFKRNRLRDFSSRKRMSRFWYGAATCKFSGCVKVDFEILKVPTVGQDVYVDAITFGVINHRHDVFEDDRSTYGEKASRSDKEGVKKRFLKGVARVQAANDIYQKRTTAKTLYFEKLSSMNSDDLTAGNITACQTPDVLRQAVFENSVRERLSVDVLVELTIQKEAWDVVVPGQINGFIQRLGHTPFFVTFYTQQQINNFIKFCRNNKAKASTIHFDCTGSLIKKMKNQKTPYFYTMLHSESNIPVMEFISTCHTTNWISAMINTFLQDVRSVTSTSCRPSCVVTDFSYSLMSAVLASFNDMSLSHYIKFSFKMLNGEPASKSWNSVTFLLICKAHLMKALSIKLTKSESSSFKRKACMSAFGRLQESKSIEVFMKKIQF
jgi:hypothetical protein